MPQLRATLLRVLGDRHGVTAAEYAVIAVGIVLLVAVAALALGTGVSNSFSRVVSAMG